MRTKKKLYFIALSLLIIESPIEANPTSPFAHVFDESIYEQDDLPARLHYRNYSSLDNRECQKTVIQLLLFKKVKCLEKHLFLKLDKELMDIRTLMSDHKTSAATKITKTLGTFFATATNLALYAFTPGLAVAKSVKTAGEFAVGGAVLTGASEFLGPDGQVDFHKITAAIERQKQDLILKLTQEPIFDLEVKYVIRKRFYKDPIIEREIEKTLILSRTDGFPPLDFQREFLENCLKLPLQKKQIDQTIPWTNLMRNAELDFTHTEIGVLRDNVTRQKLTHYNDVVRTRLSAMIRQIVASSVPGAKSERRFYYFWGKPGLGKSEAAELIPTYLDLPFFKTQIRTASDISDRSLEGADWKKELGNPGHILQALSTGYHTGRENRYEASKIPTPFNSKFSLPSEMEVPVQVERAQEPYRNTILILNDFDRLLLESNFSIEPLAFLLDYLDSNKKTFLSPYCKASIKIEDLIIIITGNTPLPDDEKFEALKDRVFEVEFQGFQPEQRTSILSSFLDDKLQMYRLTLPQEERTQLLSAETTPSIRGSKKNIETEIIQRSLRAHPLVPPILPDPDDHIDEDPQEEIHLEEIVYIPTLKDTKVIGKVQSLNKVRNAIQLLDQDQADQLKGVTALLGYRSRWGYGYIEYLWTTDSWWGNAANQNLYALQNLMSQFKTPDQKYNALQFHIQLVQSIIDILIKKFERDDFIHREILSKRYRKENLEKLFNHLVLLGQTNDQIFSNQKEKDLSQAYKRWLGVNHLKLSQFKTLYNLESPLPPMQEPPL